jgi:tetratricopeptide (TPR) repeat protein
VFSLGATLYQLLTGSPPYSGKDSQAILDAAKKRDFVPPRQRDRSVPPGLDAICQKAMAKSPGDRYPTPRELSDDITRWTADEVLTAYREPLSTRIGRWARRNRGWALTGSVALLLVTAAAIIGSGYLVQVKRSMETQRALAGFLQGLFQDVDPFGPYGFSHELRPNTARADSTTRERLEAGVDRLHHELSDQPVARAEFLEGIGNVYRSLGLYGQANVILQESLDLRKEYDPANRSAIALNQRNLALSLHYYGDYKAAAPLYKQALATLEEIHGPDHFEVALTKQQLALLLSDAQVGEFDEALGLMHEVLDSRIRMFGAQSQAVAIAYCAQALAIFATGDVDEGRIAVERAGNIFSQEDSSSHFGTAMHGYMRGLEALKSGRTNEALRLSVDALEGLKNIMPRDHPFVALALVQYIGALVESKRYIEAEERLNEAERLTAHLREDHPKKTDIRWYRAIVYLETNRGDKAQEKLQENQKHVLAAYGRASWQYAKTCEELGSLLYELDRREEALAQLRRAVAIAKRVDMNRPDRMAYFVQSLGSMLAEMGQYEEAIQLLKDAVAYRRQSDSDRKLLADSLVLLGQAQLENGELQAAQQTFRNAKKEFADFKRNTWVARVQALLGDALLRDRKVEQAEKELIEAAEAISQVRDKSHDWNKHVRRALADLYVKTDQPEKAALYTAKSVPDSEGPPLKYRVRMRRFPYSAQSERESDST